MTIIGSYNSKEVDAGAANEGTDWQCHKILPPETARKAAPVSCRLCKVPHDLTQNCLVLCAENMAVCWFHSSEEIRNELDTSLKRVCGHRCPDLSPGKDTVLCNPRAARLLEVVTPACDLPV